MQTVLMLRYRREVGGPYPSGARGNEGTRQGLGLAVFRRFLPDLSRASQSSAVQSAPSGPASRSSADGLHRPGNHLKGLVATTALLLCGSSSGWKAVQS